MLDYFCEGRSSVYVVLALAGLGLLVLWWQTRKRGFLLALAAVALLAGLHFLLDRFVETDHEQVTRKLQEMAAGVKNRNVDAILTHVSDRFHADMQGIGPMDKAELRGYIERVPDPDDGRAKIIRLTDKGRAAQSLGRELIADVERDWAERYGEEQIAALREALEMVTAERFGAVPA